MYTTSDIHLAAALLTGGARYLKAEPDRNGRGGRAIFCFENSQELQEDVVRYVNDGLSLPPRELFSRLRELKGLATEALEHGKR